MTPVSESEGRPQWVRSFRRQTPPLFETMWIETTNTDSAGEPVTRRLQHPALPTDEPIVFSENGKAQVTKDVGEAATEQFDSVRPVEADSGGDETAEADDEGNDTDDD